VNNQNNHSNFQLLTIITSVALSPNGYVCQQHLTRNWCTLLVTSEMYCALIGLEIRLQNGKLGKYFRIWSC